MLSLATIRRLSHSVIQSFLTEGFTRENTMPGLKTDWSSMDERLFQEMLNRKKALETTQRSKLREFVSKHIHVFGMTALEITRILADNADVLVDVLTPMCRKKHAITAMKTAPMRIVIDTWVKSTLMGPQTLYTVFLEFDDSVIYPLTHRGYGSASNFSLSGAKDFALELASITGAPVVERF